MRTKVRLLWEGNYLIVKPLTYHSLASVIWIFKVEWTNFLTLLEMLRGIFGSFATMWWKVIQDPKQPHFQYSQMWKLKSWPITKIKCKWLMSSCIKFYMTAILMVLGKNSMGFPLIFEVCMHPGSWIFDAKSKLFICVKWSKLDIGTTLLEIMCNMLMLSVPTMPWLSWCNLSK